jgi:hypothetical protein
MVFLQREKKEISRGEEEKREKTLNSYGIKRTQKLQF